MTVYHFRDLAMNLRLRIPAQNVKVLIVPQYKGLKIEDMLKWAEKYPQVAKALPSEPREILKLHRDYITNVIYTLVGEPFDLWVEE